MLTIQIVGIAFGFVMLYLTMLYAKRNELSRAEQFAWSAVWILIMVFALFPQVLTTVTETMQFDRTLDLLVVSGVLFVVTISFYTYLLVRKNQKKVEKLVREIAIEETEKKEK